MANTAKKVEPAYTWQEVGQVSAVDDESIAVAGQARDYQARRAVSCLVAPQKGDRVLLSVPDKGAIYVLAILERAPCDRPSPTRLEVAGDLELSATGQLRLSAQQGIDVLTPKDLSVISARTVVHTGAAAVVVRGVASLCAQAVETVADRLLVTCENTFRRVLGLERVHAGVIEHRADTTAALRGREAFVTATELIKVQGRQVHIG